MVVESLAKAEFLGFSFEFSRRVGSWEGEILPRGSGRGRFGLELLQKLVHSAKKAKASAKTGARFCGHGSGAFAGGVPKEDVVVGQIPNRLAPSKHPHPH